MGSKIKTFLWVHRTDLLTVLIVGLTVSAAFQMGRLSVQYGPETGFEIHASR